MAAESDLPAELQCPYLQADLSFQTRFFNSRAWDEGLEKMQDLLADLKSQCTRAHCEAYSNPLAGPRGDDAFVKVKFGDVELELRALYPCPHVGEKVTLDCARSMDFYIDSASVRFVKAMRTAFLFVRELESKDSAVDGPLVLSLSSVDYDLPVIVHLQRVGTTFKQLYESLKQVPCAPSPFPTKITLQEDAFFAAFALSKNKEFRFQIRTTKKAQMLTPLKGLLRPAPSAKCTCANRTCTCVQK